MYDKKLRLHFLEGSLDSDGVLRTALRYEHDRENAGADERPFKDDARILLYMIEDKPHLAIKYISEALSEKDTP